jgi:hypothetical protein
MASKADASSNRQNYAPEPYRWKGKLPNDPNGQNTAQPVSPEMTVSPEITA